MTKLAALLTATLLVILPAALVWSAVAGRISTLGGTF